MWWMIKVEWLWLMIVIKCTSTNSIVQVIGILYSFYYCQGFYYIPGLSLQGSIPCISPLHMQSGRVIRACYGVASLLRSRLPSRSHVA